jgi:uncharacterized protein YdaU (DUF1376 family)
MSLPYFPMYPTDFEAKTSHLTLTEDGAYNRLLRLMWMTPGCSLPDDEYWIMRRMRCDQATFDSVVAPIISEFMTRKSGRVISSRLRQEWEKADETYRLRSEAGKKGGRPQASDNKAKQAKPGLSQPKAGPKQPEPEPEPELEKKREAKASSKKPRASRLSDDWYLPKEWGDWALDQGLVPDGIRIEADTFRDYWHSKAGPTASKMDWQATWRNWIRNAQKRTPTLITIHGGRNGKFAANQDGRGHRPDPAIDNIARLAGIGRASGDGGG